MMAKARTAIGTTSAPGTGAGLADDAELHSTFMAIDWAFATSVSVPPHDIHPYPARFIPEIPAAAISLAAGLHGAVFDPFCGAGTTLVEAIRADRESIGIDLNPIAALISRVKVQRWDSGDDRQLDKYAVGLRWAASRGSPEVLEEVQRRIPRVDHWFRPEAQQLLAGATAFVKTIDDPVWRDRVALAVSGSVVRVSRQDSDTRYAAVDKRFDADRAARQLEADLVKVATQLRSFAPSHTGRSARVVTTDAASAAEYLGPSSVAAAVFSPPYPNAYEYWLYHKYRMYWLGFDPLSVRASEWGARPHYSGGGKSTIETFSRQMAPVMGAIADALVPNGICLVVVGDSLIKGELVDNASLFQRLASSAGLRFVGSSARPIRANRKSFNLAVARARTEHVLLFRR